MSREVPLLSLWSLFKRFWGEKIDEPPGLFAGVTDVDVDAGSDGVPCLFILETTDAEPPSTKDLINDDVEEGVAVVGINAWLLLVGAGSFRFTILTSLESSSSLISA